jgi:hypothetical protein
MSKERIVPKANFRVTPRARAKLEQLTDELRDDRKRYIVSFGWDEAFDEIRREIVGHGLVVGWFDEATLASIGEEPQIVDGLRLTFSVTPAQAAHFEGQTIDFDGLRFHFVSRGALPPDE